MKAFSIVTALFLLTISCATGPAKQMQSCETLAAISQDEVRDQLLLSACIAEIGSECGIKDIDCQRDYQLQCIEAFLLLKAEEVRQTRLQQCWK